MLEVRSEKVEKRKGAMWFEKRVKGIYRSLIGYDQPIQLIEGNVFAQDTSSNLFCQNPKTKGKDPEKSGRWDLASLQSPKNNSADILEIANDHQAHVIGNGLEQRRQRK